MIGERKLRVVIADDEPLARQRIEDLLEKESDLELAGVSESGPEAVEMVRSLRPDLLFLDVQMPGITGTEVAAEIGEEELPPTIFVTAYSDYAVKAFDLAAVDYLVKPFDDERFAQALQRARAAIQRADDERAAEQQHQYLERIAVESRGQVRAVPVEKIDFIAADGPYAELHAGPNTWVIRERMHQLEQRLDPALFFRIHRSAIVRIDRIETFLKKTGGDYAVRLKDGTELSVSRNRRDALERILGVDKR
jgi:two-component system, LytTR family, response regulator